MNTINVILNGKPVKGNSNETVLEVAARYGVEIPTLCHDPRIAPFSSCFVCVVHIENMRGMQPSCSTKITEGMSIITDSESVIKARQSALNLLLSNHYADCVAPCKQTCPAGVDIQGYISLIEKGLYSQAIGLIKETNPLPAICGRVCVRPCEVACRRNLLDENTGVGIDYLKRFAADKDLESEHHYKPEVAPSTGKKVAIIGGGPGGLSAAYFLQQKGHQCDIYESAPAVGGWLRYGIPEYRLPNDVIDKEVATITELGVSISCNKKLGENISYKDIREQYDATLITIGSQKGTLVGVEGDDAENVFSGIDFLRNMAMTGQVYNFKGKTVAVVGGGNTAMDCCRTSIRCGAEKVFVIYRRTEKEMPANPIEIHESKLEGVEYLFLTNPVKINKDEKGVLKSVTCVKMALGEPDSSGRRRPVPVDGSEFDIELDYMLAAIGQKTDVNFIEDMNSNAKSGEFRINKWGDVDANPNTFETGIPGVFSAGDCVSGPATIIEAIAQAKTASLSCHQYLMGEPIQGVQKEFISKKDNFKEQHSAEYKNKYLKQMRHEMPVLDASLRMNFDEVELGYENEVVVKTETARCMECGCSALYTCDLKNHATKYGVNQKAYPGEFKEYNVDFSHPYIEIDNNKCILCGRCIRICKEVVGANALGFINRGYDTYVAPSMGQSLTETTCESCGLCLSTCPTGALAENTPFKPGPVKAQQFDTVCNFCSIGCEITLHHINGFFIKATGKNGAINTDGNICRFPKFGYKLFNPENRITQPMFRKNDTFTPISWIEAFQIIKDRISAVQADENVFFAGARLSNAEQYLIQKIARAGVKTNNVTSLYYIERGRGQHNATYKNVPFSEISKAKQIILFGSEINMENAVAGFMVQNAQTTNATHVQLVTTEKTTKVDHKVDSIIRISSYYAFIKAVNHYLLTIGQQNQLFINDNTQGFQEYKKNLFTSFYDELVDEAGVSKEVIETFANSYNTIHESILIFSEAHVDSATAMEIFNLSMITGKLGKTAAGIIMLLEKNNSQGLTDMGLCAKRGVGRQDMSNPQFIDKLKNIWQVNEIPTVKDYSLVDKMKQYEIRNMFIFGEDPIGCAIDEKEVSEIMFQSEFLCVQDFFMTPTALAANLVLPASFHFESGGSFTNTQQYIQEFSKEMNSPVGKSNLEILNYIMQMLNLKTYNSVEEVMEEIYSLLPAEMKSLTFTSTNKAKPGRIYSYGCDALSRMLAEEMSSKLENNL